MHPDQTHTGTLLIVGFAKNRTLKWASGHLSAFSKPCLPEACPYIDHVTCRLLPPPSRNTGAKCPNARCTVYLAIEALVRWFKVLDISSSSVRTTYWCCSRYSCSPQFNSHWTLYNQALCPLSFGIVINFVMFLFIICFIICFHWP